MKSETVTSAQSSAGLVQPQYRADIDGLRAIAVIGVLAFHAFPDVFTGGFVGVDVFFVISGFLITTLIIGSVHAREFSLHEFYARRIKRIFPALAIVLVGSYALGWGTLFEDEFAQLGKQIAGGAGFISNFVLLNEAGYFDTSAQAKPLLHLWSLGVEEQFYLVWPMLIYVALRLRINLLFIAIAGALVSFWFNAAGIHHDAAAVFYSPLTRLWEPLAGSALAYVAVTKPPSKDPKQNGPNWPFASKDMHSLAGAALIIIAVVAINRKDAFPGWWALLPTAGAVLVISAGPTAWINRSVLSNRFFVWIGLISYPLYLWHWPALAFGHILSPNGMTAELRIAVVAMSLILAILTYFLIERPIRSSGSSKAVVFALCIVMAAIGFVGLSTYAGDGFAFRDANLSARMFASDKGDRVILSDGSCEKLLGRPVTRNEICLAKTPTPKILVLGDSHARVFNSAAYAGNSPLNTLLIAGSSCLPFLNYITRGPNEDEDNRDCDNITAKALAAANGIPSIKTVVLVTMGPDYFTGHEFKGNKIDTSLFLRGSNVPADAKRAFVEGYIDTVSKFTALGKRVVFVIDVPELGFDPRNCIVRSVRLSSRPNCFVDRREVDERQKEYRTFVDAIANANPSLIIYDTLPVFCDAIECTWYDSGGSFYSDMHHLNIHGSRKLLAAFSKWLNEQSITNGRPDTRG